MIIIAPSALWSISWISVVHLIRRHPRRDRNRFGLCRSYSLRLYPTYTGGISLHPIARTQHPFPALELYTQEQAGPSCSHSRRHNRRAPAVTFVLQQGEVDLPEGIPQVYLSDTGASTSSHGTLIPPPPPEYFADPDMSRRLNLAAMVGRSGSLTPSASPSTTPIARAPTSSHALALGSSSSGLLADARR
ncbi:hypothetical protein RHGRI_030924 [Rhododendron griersonianum]|uniref:Uncharacterized protein n=1 Tax=Rhododendron griersonianum TaxID=479676 RepID=A0AAV6I9A7_9ERIC|nr:hypothetical protein RHGRI_030924 [Rhododendron griersonianum]